MTDLLGQTARLIDATTGRILAADELRAAVEECAAGYRDVPPGMILAFTGTALTDVLRYLGAFQARRPITLLDPSLRPAVTRELIDRFLPACVFGVDDDRASQYLASPPVRYREAALGPLGRAWIREAEVGPRPHPDLAVLLATSGSTGNPKLVRLSRAGVLANNLAIGEALGIDVEDVAPTSLPLFYSYGLSILNSHLVAGATVVIADGGVLTRSFWDACSRFAATSLAGVPHTYQMLQRIRWKPSSQPTLRYLTQAGGRLQPDLVTEFSRQLPLYVMYGQTEAGPRMTTLPAHLLPEKLGSVGPALPGGRLSVLPPDGPETTAAGVSGEVIFRGPNVMMGYADNAADLARGDDCAGVLHTGDVGQLDADGCLWLTGRVNRLGKVFGIRINLDDVEAILEDFGSVAATSTDDRIIVYCEELPAADADAVVGRLAGELGLHRSGFDARPIDLLPRLANGKVDYHTLTAPEKAV